MSADILGPRLPMEFSLEDASYFSRDLKFHVASTAWFRKVNYHPIMPSPGSNFNVFNSGIESLGTRCMKHDSMARVHFRHQFYLEYGSLIRRFSFSVVAT